MVDSLRSIVAKGAMITIREMHEALPQKSMESSLDTVFGILIKKSSDSNFFISEEADRCLLAICTYAKETKML